MKFMKFCFLAFLFLITINGWTQKSVRLDDLKNNVDELVEVKGKVSEILSVIKGKDQQAVVYIGGKRPNEKLTVIIKNVIKGKTDYILTEKKYINSFATVKGRVRLNDGKPEVVVDSADDLSFIVDEEVYN